MSVGLDGGTAPMVNLQCVSERPLLSLCDRELCHRWVSGSTVCSALFATRAALEEMVLK